MANKRIYFANQQVAIRGDEEGSENFETPDALHGIQSIGMSTNFNLSQVFELGQLPIYENIEDIPDVEVTMTKVLDGYPLIYHRATKDSTSTGPTLVNRSNSKCIFGLGIWPDTSDAAVGNATSVVECSGMYPSSISYNFPVDDNFTEDVTLVGNNKIWAYQPAFYGTTHPVGPSVSGINPVMAGAFSLTSDDSPTGNNIVNRRPHLLFAYVTTSGVDVNGMVADPDATILPPEVYGISLSGTNDETASVYGASIQRISVSVDLGREQINELGRRGPYARIVTFPVEVTTEIEAISKSGDFVSATEDGTYTTGTDVCSNTAGNLQNNTIRIATCDGTRIYCGSKNKLASVNYGGGDAGGGNATNTYTYSSFNVMTVIHPNDPHANGPTWATNASKGAYLVSF